jgi:hypothetical protein
MTGLLIVAAVCWAGISKHNAKTKRETTLYLTTEKSVEVSPQGMTFLP